MKLKEPVNVNYSAEIVKLEHCTRHSNADALLCWKVLGYNVITNLDAKEGELRVFFPIECKLSDEYLSKNNLYRHENLNFNPKEKGYFEDNGRVKAIRLRGEPSEGIVMPLESLSIFGVDINEFNVGDRFDTLNDKKVCEKYIVKRGKSNGSNNGEQYESKIIPGQFRFHKDTEQLQRSIRDYSPDDIVTISYKLHGTSGISAHIITKKRINKFQTFLKWLGFKIEDTEYSHIYSSRTVIRNGSFEDVEKPEEFRKLVHDSIKDKLPKGYTLYYEIVGFEPSGKYIQKSFDYGCKGGEYDIYVYRGTYTSPNNIVIEFSYPQLQEFCKGVELKTAPILWAGQLSNLVEYNPPKITEKLIEEKLSEVGSINTTDDERRQWAIYCITKDSLNAWRDLLFEELKKRFTDKDCYICTNKVPEEGVVIRKEMTDPETWKAHKLKSFRFLEFESKELDKGEENIEDTQ